MSEKPERNSGTRLHSIKKLSSRDLNLDDLRALLHFSPETGQIWLHEHRMLLVHAESQSELRKELIETFGVDRARGLLTRMGYNSGMRDCELARTHTHAETDLEAYLIGISFHTLEGIVRPVPVKLEVDCGSGRFYAELRWENSWESQWHRRYYGTNTEPRCWSQIGYACGYSSAFMGRPILFKEVECICMGNPHCRVIGKPIEEWDDASEYMRFFNRESMITEQLIDLQSQVVELRSAMGEKEKAPAESIVGNSPAFKAAYELLKKAATSQVAVLLLGETGVGKEVFARELHDRSTRRSDPFVAINCAAIPHDLVESELFGVEKGAYTGALISRAGRFERANGGTLFLDEIGDLPLPAQAKLLRVLQEGEVERLGDQRTRKIDVRLVAATNVDLKLLVKEGKFRSDLYFRLNTFQINIMPLRERREDITLLSRRFLAKYAAIHGKRLRGFTDKARRALLAYPWPGNIRELQNTIERGVILASNDTRLEVEHLFPAYSDDSSLVFGLDQDGSIDFSPQESGKDLYEAVINGNMTLDHAEIMLIKAALDKTRGNVAAAARILGLTRPQLVYRLKHLHEKESLMVEVDSANELGG